MGPRGIASSVFRWLGNLSTAKLLCVWLLVILTFATAYWLVGGLTGNGSSAEPSHTLQSWLDAAYFSVVTATSLGYGDLVPQGTTRILALVEATIGLLLLSAVISKFVSRRQEAMLEEVHRLSFENRLGRVHASLNGILSDLHDTHERCVEHRLDPKRIDARLESLANLLANDVRTIHDLLYRPQEEPDETTLTNILISLATVLEEWQALRACRPERPEEPLERLRWEEQIPRTMALAEQICGDCVPIRYQETLRSWMDRIRDLARATSSSPMV